MQFSDNSALLVIDAQKGMLIPKDEQPIPCLDAPVCIKTIEEVLKIFRSAKLPIIHFRELHRKEMVDFGRELDGSEGVHYLEGSEEAETIDTVAPIEGEFSIQKRRYSGFFATDLDLLLRGLQVEHLFIVGFLTDVCVHYTAADAHQYNYHIHVISDAVRGSSWEAHDAALRAIEYLQQGSVITLSDLKI
jgi:biuret amidohydrolase